MAYHSKKALSKRVRTMTPRKKKIVKTSKKGKK